MPNPPAHSRFAFAGSLPGAETFSFSFAAPTSGASANEEVSSFSATPEFEAFVNAVKPLWNPGTVLNRLTVYRYNAAGRLVDQFGMNPGSIAGTSNQGTPNQCALVVSLRGSTGAGIVRGRMFLPATGVTINVGSGKAPIDTQGIANAALVMLDSKSAVVASETLGALAPINQVRVGDVIDTIRHRRDKLRETYAVGNFS